MATTIKKHKKHVPTWTKVFKDGEWWIYNAELCAKMIYFASKFDITMSESEYPNKLKLYVENLKQIYYIMNEFFDVIIDTSKNPEEEQMRLDDIINDVYKIIDNSVSIVDVMDDFLKNAKSTD